MNCVVKWHTVDSIEKLIRRVEKTRHGFSDIQKAADEVVANNAARDSVRIAKTLYASGVHQARMLATLVFGRCAAQSSECLKYLQARVSKDKDWRVQEMLAQAFDRYCRDTGYAQALPVVQEWLAVTAQPSRYAPRNVIPARFRRESRSPASGEPGCPTEAFGHDG